MKQLFLKATLAIAILAMTGTSSPALVFAANDPAAPSVPVIPGADIGNGSTSSTTSTTTSATTSSTTTTPNTAAITVTPTTAADSSSTPYFGVNMTSCLRVFDWKDYITRSSKGQVNFSSFYDAVEMQHTAEGLAQPTTGKQIGCLRKEGLVVDGERKVTKDAQGKVTAVNYDLFSAPKVTAQKYAEFPNNSQVRANTIAQLPNIPILGITEQALKSYRPNGTLITDKASTNRTVKAGLSSVYPETDPRETDPNLRKDLQSIYSTGGTRTGLPRLPYTGKEEFIKVGDQLTWNGGLCKVEGGKLVFRTSWTGQDPDDATKNLSYPVTPADVGVSPTPIAACAWPNKPEFASLGLVDPDGLVKDQNLEIYQYVYKLPYPKTKADCDSWFPQSFSTYETCIAWFRERYSKSLTGASSGQEKDLYYTYTYYGAWNDKYTRWIGWAQPDVAGPRKTFTLPNATLEELRAYLDDPELTMRQVLGDTTSNYAQLKAKINSASDAIKNEYKDKLKTQYEGYIRGLDGYSIYVY